MSGKHTYQFEWGADATDDHLRIDIEAGADWAAEYEQIRQLIDDIVAPRADDSDELDKPLITRKMKDAGVYHTMRCQYVRRASPSRTREATPQLLSSHDLDECRYCRAKRCDDVDDPRAGVEQEETAKLLRNADPDAIGGD